MKKNWLPITLGLILALVLGLALFGKIPTPFASQEAPAPTQALATPTQQVIVVTATDTPLGANGLVRRESGQNNSIAFNPGEMVYGWQIVLVDGRRCDGGECFLTSAPVAGIVTSGVVNPWATEIVGKTDSIFSLYATPTPFVVVAPTSAVPYNLPPQMQIGHPSLYLETGVPDPYGTNVDANTKHWRIELLPGTVAIIGGFKVDGVTNGVYKAIAGPGVVETTVTDGFILVTTAEWANAEFCFRISQAKQFNWAHNTIQPLPGWSNCR